MDKTDNAELVGRLKKIIAKHLFGYLAEIDRLTKLIEDHNDECDSICSYRQDNNGACEYASQQNGRCASCPRDYRIDVQSNLKVYHA